MSEFCKWSEGYDIGDRVIDFQHQQLFKIINTLYEDRHSPATQKKCFVELKLYAINHFTTEEEVMRAHGYPEADLLNHRKMHSNFANKVNDFCMAVEDGETVLMDLVMDYLKKWLSHHVLESDRELVPFLRTSKAI